MLVWQCMEASGFGNYIKGFTASSEYHRFKENQNLNPQKFSELPFYPLTDPGDSSHA